MSGGPPSSRNDAVSRLQHCIRDLAALNALPSMCVGRSPEEALEIIVDLLPTALGCELVYLVLPSAPPTERLSLGKALVSTEQLAAVKAALSAAPDAEGARVVPGRGRFWCLDADIPIGARRGQLVAGRSGPMDPEIDRVLVRSAANLVGTTLETANVLDSARRKDEFLAILGHELRNPLMPIATAVELLRRAPEVAREREVIDRQTRHLTRLVDDLLDISRVTRGHVELRSEVVELSAILERAVELATPLLSRHRHELRVDAVEGVAILGDPVRLAQVFGNLLTNAAKFTPPGGKIAVAVEGGAGRVRVIVRDSGRGISRDQLSRIFQPFVQVDRQGDALRGGLGLGLAIVSNLVERHGGTITASSDGPGRGAAFTVELPTTAAVQPTPTPTRAEPATTRAGVRVMVVDDNVDVAELLSEALQIEGFQTKIAHDGHAALADWDSFGPHAAVLDVGLPELDGYELARRVRKSHGRAPTLIAATGYGEPQHRTRAADAGFDCHFVKPVSIEDLVRALDQRVVRAAAAQL